METIPQTAGREASREHFYRIFTLGVTRKSRSRYPKMPVDEERALIELQHTGAEEQSREAAQKLVTQYMPMIKGLVSAYAGKGIDTEELIEIGRDAFFYAITHFEGGHNARLPTYATYWVISFITKRFRSMRRKETPLYSIDENESLWTGEYPDCLDDRYLRQPTPTAETLTAFREICDAFDDAIKHKLLAIERHIICRVSGYKQRNGAVSLETIGKEYGLSRESMRNWKNRALQKLEMTENQLHAIAEAYEVLQAQV